MATREYIGSRYVPEFGRHGEESIAWDDSAPYEPLTIVLYQGNSYTSRQYVPAGVPITNETYWAETGNFNAQVEAYRSEVQGFDSRIDALETPIDKILVIGDSFSSHSSNGLWTATWPQTLADKNDLELTNIAQPGAGFVHGQALIWQQMTVTAPALSDKELYKYIIVYGGVNDARGGDDTSAVTQNIRDGLNALASNFPNAQIFVCGVNAGLETFKSSPSDIFETYQAAMQSGVRASTSNAIFIDARKWLMCIAGTYTTDELHPENNNGNIILLYTFNQIIHGNYKPYTYVATYTPNSSASMGILLPTKLEVCNGRLRIPQCMATKAAETALNVNTTIGTIANLPFRTGSGELRIVADGLAIASDNTFIPFVVRVALNGSVALILDEAPTTELEYTFYLKAQEPGY